MSKTTSLLVISSLFWLSSLSTYCFGSFFYESESESGDGQAFSNGNTNMNKASSDIPTSVVTPSPLLQSVQSVPNYRSYQRASYKKMPLPRILGQREITFLKSIYENPEIKKTNKIDLDEELSKLGEIKGNITCFRLPTVYCTTKARERIRISVNIKSARHIPPSLIISYVAVYGNGGAKLIKYENDLYCTNNKIYRFNSPDLSAYLPAASSASVSSSLSCLPF